MNNAAAAGRTQLLLALQIGVSLVCGALVGAVVAMLVVSMGHEQLLWLSYGFGATTAAAVMGLFAWLDQSKIQRLLVYVSHDVAGDEGQTPVNLSGSLLTLAQTYDALRHRCLSVENSLSKAATSVNQVLGTVEPLMHQFRTDAETAKPSEQLLAQLDTLVGCVRQADDVLAALDKSLGDRSDTALVAMSTRNNTGESVQQLSESVDETAASLEEMTYSIKEVARNIEELSLAAEQTATSMNQMDSSISEVESNVKVTSQLVDEVARDASTGAEAVHRTLEGIEKIRVTVSTAAGVISGLGERIREIGNILSVIEDVAEQTNLLALNAAIIAAQAGEHGRGFAVVADEIKELADKTGASTKEIASLIIAIQEESLRAVQAMSAGEKNVAEGVQLSREAEEALAKILNSAEKSTQRFRAIAASTVEQSRGSKIVADAVDRIARSVQQVAAATSEQARGSEQLMRSAEHMRDITEQVEMLGAEDSTTLARSAQLAKNFAQGVVALQKIFVEQKEQLGQLHGHVQTLAEDSDLRHDSMETFLLLPRKLQTEMQHAITLSGTWNENEADADSVEQ